MRDFIILILLFSVHGLSAQALKQDKIPSAVLEKFKELYPGEKMVMWEKKVNTYEAGVYKEGVETVVSIDSSGTYLKKETGLVEKQMPPIAINYRKEKYPKVKLIGYVKVEDNNKVVTYKIELYDRTLLFNKSGGYISEELRVIK